MKDNDDRKISATRSTIRQHDEETASTSARASLNHRDDDLEDHDRDDLAAAAANDSVAAHRLPDKFRVERASRASSQRTSGSSHEQITGKTSSTRRTLASTASSNSTPGAFAVAGLSASLQDNIKQVFLNNTYGLISGHFAMITPCAIAIKSSL